MNFWKELKETGKPFFVLAPMADVTDMAFRQIICLTGRPDVFYTEFVSAAGLCSDKGRPKLLPHFKFSENERPIVAQIFGSVPKHFYECAKLIAKLGFDGIDINMGCPDRKVLKQGAGIALCKTPELALEIIKATRQGLADAGSQIPISVKTRLGYENIDIPWIRKLLSSNIEALTIHLRTMREMSKVPAHWELAEEISSLAHSLAPDTVLVANGDIMTYAEGIDKSKKFKLDGVMIGRGIFSNPWFFDPSIDMNNKSSKERISLLKTHISNFINLWGNTKNFDTMKRFFKIYIHSFNGSKELRDELMKTKTPEQAFAVLDNVI